jgi:fibro-slime domain-containing protein
MSSRILALLVTTLAFGCAESDGVSASPRGETGAGGQGGAPAPNDGGGLPGGDEEDEPSCQEIVVGEAQLEGVIRDFVDSHPDFEGPLEKMGYETGIVGTDLGNSNKPVYAGNPVTLTTNGVEPFRQWYTDVPGVNLTIPFSLTLVEGSDGIHRYDDTDFFPADGQGFGNQGRSHNYHFTVELHTSFLYQGGEVFTFRGDDDLFVFINRRLAIDLGGVHTSLEASVDLDAAAAQLGIFPDNVYELHFFFAERHTDFSDFHIETSIGTFLDCSEGAAP